MNKISIIALAAIIPLALTSCGSSREDRAASGAGIGAGVGALGSALTGGSPWTGALVGGAGGAAVGAFTDEDQVNFGRPAWRR